MIKVATYTKMLTLSAMQKAALLVLVIVACTSNAVFASPPLTHLSAKTYGVGEVLAMEQDKFGFLWIGGRSGLARYDGYTFDQYRATPASTALRSNAIYDLASDSLGNLWIATEQGLNLYNYAEDNFSYIALIDAQGAPIDSTIYHMHLDSSGKTLWLATRAGLYSIDIQSQRLTRYPRTEKEAALQSEYVLDIADDGQGTLYMATGFGLRVWNQKSGEIKSFQVDNPKDTGLRHNIIRSVLVDSLSRIWVGTDAGLLRFIPSRDQFEFIPNTLDAPDATQGVAVWDMMEDDEQQIWVAYDGHGIGIVDGNGKITANYQHNPGNPQSPSFNVLRRFYQDNEKSIWMSYYPGGLSQAINGADNIKALIHKPGDPHSLSMNNVRSIYIDRNDKYWIGTDGGGLNSYDPASDSFEVFRHSADDPTSIGANETLAIKPDADNNLWLGSWVAGISIFNPAERRFFKRMVVDPGRTETPLSSEHVWDVLHHSNGTVWIATIGGGLNIYNPAQKTMKHMINEQGGLGDPIADHKIWSLLEDQQGFVWLGTQNGISRIAPDTLMTKTWRRNQATEDNGLTADRILDIYEDSNNNLWFAGDGGGLIRFDSATEKFSAIRQADGLISDTVVSIIEDETKNLWLGTDKGLSRYSLMTGAIFNLHPGSNLQDEGFNYGAVTKSPRGELAFGGINGLTIFDPRKITPNTIIPPVVYTQLEMIDSNTEDGDKLVQRPLQTVDSLLLNHHQNIFSISFSALSYQRPGLNQYKYKLEGFDREWRSPGIERRATYTNLPAGNYAFLVMASNSDGVWTPTPASLRIKITPAPWNTWWAYSIYILSLTAAVFYVWNNQRRKIQLEQSTNRELLRIDKLKDEFLVSTSDELREPLFGIIGLAENIIDNKNPQARKLELNNLSMIVASANRLSALVDDVADFAKIRSKKISLDIKSIDIYVAATLVSSMLQPLIALEKVKIINQITKDLPAVSADENRIQQILHNLIDFAIRHSAEEVIYLDAQPLSGKNLIKFQSTQPACTSASINLCSSVAIRSHKLMDQAMKKMPI